MVRIASGSSARFTLRNVFMTHPTKPQWMEAIKRDRRYVRIDFAQSNDEMHPPVTKPAAELREGAKTSAR
jgi:hypothetical protein